MPTHTYDTILLGDDLSGLIAAALCGRRGLRVLVAETLATPPESYRLGPYTFARAPLLFVGETSPAVRRVLAELNLQQTMKRRLQPIRSVQVALPDARLELAGSPELFARELDREFPAEREQIERLCERAAEFSRGLETILAQEICLPPEGFWERRELARAAPLAPAADEDLLPGLAPDHPVRALIALPAAFSLGVDPRAASPAAILRCLDLWRRGIARFTGGQESLRQMLLEKMNTQQACEVRTVVPERFETRWGRVTGLVLRDRGELLGTATLLGATAIADLGDLFGERRPKKVLELGRAVVPTAYRYILHLVVYEAGLPEGLSPVTLAAFDPRRPLVGDNAMAIYAGDPDGETRVVLTLVANCPGPEEGHTLADQLALLRVKLLRRLEQLMPFVSGHVLAMHSPNEAHAPEGIETKETAPRLAPEPLYTSTLPATLGVSAAPYSVGARGVIAASRQVLPGLGLEGDFATGASAARLACHAAGRKKDYLNHAVLAGD